MGDLRDGGISPKGVAAALPDQTSARSKVARNKQIEKTMRVRTDNTYFWAPRKKTRRDDEPLVLKRDNVQ